MKPRAHSWAYAAFLICGVLYGGSAEAQAQSLAEALAGDWVGTGTLANGYEAAPQTGRCRVEIAQGEDKAVLDITGTCAIPSGRSRFALRAVLDGDNRVRAAARANGVEGTTQYAGTVTRTGLDIVSRAPVILDDAQFQSRFVIKLPAKNAFRMLHWLQPADAASARQTLAMDFQRKQGMP